MAIVGMGCRFPGADSPAAFWRLLAEGVDAVREVPADRWDAAAAYGAGPDARAAEGTRWGGFVEGIDRFDAGFFSIAPREAEQMDPQQRLLLETAWEALDDAGLDAERLAGSRTGVFVGISGSDYGRAQLSDPARGDAYTGTGGALSIAANRLSYALDLRGPSMAVDTACSSSLVALHLACRSLREGECDAALVGGVNALLSPAVTVSLARAGLISPDGRCRAFDTGASGYVRGEGAGVVVIKPLSRAVADGDRVYAAILATHLNQDGRSNGLSAPTRAAQEAVVREACTQAGVAPASVQYVEAHGTGTALGDSIEAQALGAVLGQGRTDGAPCLLGSVKTNIGHLESASGIASVIKVALSIHHRALPPSLHCPAPSPAIPFAALGLKVHTEPAPWPAAPGLVRAGVNSFGFGGTNAHAILADGPGDGSSVSAVSPKRADDGDGAVLIPLSARTPAALAELAAAYRDTLRAGGGDALADVAYTASLRRTHHDHRLAVTGSTRAALADALDAFLAGRASSFVAAGRRMPRHAAGQVAVPSVYRGDAGAEDTLAALAARYVRGDAVDWTALHPRGGRVVTLPSYPWQRERFWAIPPADAGTRPARRHTAVAHLPGTHLWTWRGPRTALEGMAEGAGLPGASPAALAALAVAEVFGGAPRVSPDVAELGPLPDDGAVEVQAVLERPDEDVVRVRLFARAPGAAAWTTLAEGTSPVILASAADPHPESAASAESIQSPAAKGKVGTALARILAAAGAERETHAAEYLRSALGRVLRMAPERVEHDRPVTELGLDSLMAMEARNAIARDLRIPLALSTFFSGLTVGALTAFVIERIGHGGTDEDDEPAREGAGPLTEGQRALWFLHQLEPASAASNVFAAMRVHGAMDEGALRRAFQALADRHPALRTAFRVEDGTPVQEPLTPPVDFVRVDTGGLDDAAFAARLGDDAHAPFDLARGEVFRVRLYPRPGGAPVLLLAMHHAVTDFWSGVVMLRDLAALYAGETEGAAPELPPVEATPADAARWEAALLAGDEGRRLAELWGTRLVGLPVLALPADRPRAATATGEGACHGFRISAARTAAVHALARRHGTTPFVVLLAVYQALLSRWSGQDDVAVASPLAGRTRAAWENTVGLFMNPVILRGDLSGAPPLSGLLERTRAVVADALELQAFPLARAAELVQAGRGAGAPAGEPPFQAMFVLNRPHHLQEAGLAGIMVGQDGARFAHGRLELEGVPVQERTAVCDLCLWMGESGGALHARLQYAADRFEAATAARMAESFGVLLDAALAAPETRVDALPLLTGDARRRVLDAWSAGGGLDDGFDAVQDPTADGGGADAFVPVTAMIARRAADAPDATAVAWGGERVSCGELDRRANQLAHHLRAAGVGADTVVGLCLERSVELLVGMLGILKAGGAYLPLDPAHPAERRAWMLDDARAPVVVTRRGLADELDDGVRALVRLDADRAALARRPQDDPAPAMDGENLAYVIYTSGSTGRPKGTLIRHAALSSHTRSAADAYALSPADRVLQFASATFDASVEEIFPALARGAALVLRPERVLGAVGELLSFCAAEGITVLDLPTAYWHQLAAALRDEGLALPECVRLVIIGGERALPDRVAAWNGRVPASVALVNTYGPTEATVVATRHRIAADANGAAEVPIGRPIRGVRAYVLDGRMQPVPQGVVGALYLGGGGLARGYLGRPARTAAAFVPDPFSPAPGGRLYATGDRARHLPDGALEFAVRAATGWSRARWRPPWRSTRTCERAPWRPGRTCPGSGGWWRTWRRAAIPRPRRGRCASSSASWSRTSWCRRRSSFSPPCP
jgi:amino acid adenylation domain-containing protein